MLHQIASVRPRRASFVGETLEERSGLVFFEALALITVAIATNETPTTNDVIEVRIGRIKQDIREVTAPVSVLTRDDIVLLQGADLGDLLIALPGVTVEGGERSEALQPNIRGLGESRVVSRIDGARQNISISHRGQSFIDPALIGQVEVLRGPGSTLYGSGSVGGVINLETLNPSQLVTGDSALAGRLVLRGSTNADRAGATAAAAYQGERIGTLLALSADIADEYEDGAGETVPFSDTNQSSVLAKAVIDDVADGTLSLTYAGYREESESLLTADRAEGDPVDRETTQDIASLQYRNSSTGLWSPELTLYGVDTRFDERLLDQSETRTNGLKTIGLDAVNVSQFSVAGNNATVVAGLELYRDTQEGTRNGAPNPGFASSELTATGVFALGELNLTGRLTVIAGVRADTFQLKAAREDLADTDLDATSPSLAATYAISEAVSVRASYAEAFRTPSLRQLFIGGPHFPGNDYVPNTDLKPETARNFELGVTWRFDVLDGELSGEAFVFKNEIDDFIEQVVAATTTSFLNVGEAEIDGVEFRLQYSTALYDFSLTAQALDGDNLGRAEPLQSIPANELAIQIVRRAPQAGLEFGARFIATAAQNDVPGRPFTIAATNSHERLDLFARWDIPSSPATLVAGVDNVTDQTYRRHLSQINAPGRAFKFSLIADF